MAQSTARGNYAQFSVIARMRQGIASSLSTYGVILEIQHHLSSYKCICNVAFSPPNYIIHLPTVELQLDLLSRKSLTGSDYVLDMVPWSFEYISFGLPWIITSLTQNEETRIQADSKNSKNVNAGSMQSTVAGPCFLQLATDKQQGPIWKSTKVKINSFHRTDDTQMPIDFSYLMVAELKQFYNKKIKAFQDCSLAYQQIYDIAQNFSTNVDKAIKSTCEATYSAGMFRRPTDQPMVSADDLNNTLWFISEEMFGLALTKSSIYNSLRQPINLHNFFDQHSTEKAVEPIIAVTSLKAIAESVTSQIYERNLLIATAEDLIGMFCTQVWCSYFHHEYKASMELSKEQAEANAIYRFLKYVSNNLGYTIEDSNCDTLYTIVSQINDLTASLSSLQASINAITAMIRTVDKNVRQVFMCDDDRTVTGPLPHTNQHINNLLCLVRHYYEAAQNSSQAFLERKEAFRCIKFQSAYPSASD